MEEAQTLDKTEVCSDMEHFFRRLRLREYFNDTEDSENTWTEGKGILTTKKRSDWTPPHGRNPHLDKYIDSFRHLIKSTIIDTNRGKASNISAQERKAIQSLKSNKEIIIKPADKAGAIVMMNTSDYMKEAKTQLMDTRYYKKLESDPTQDYYKELNKLVSCLPDESTRADGLIPKSPRTGIFYMHPKIYKSGNPERPIISCVGTLTEQVSGWVEGILKPLVKDTPSYMQDTTDLLNKLSAIGPLPKGTILATMDVQSLYSNIPPQDGINACKFFLENTGTDADSVVKLIKFILTRNYFKFHNKIYLQETGTAMGSKMAPQYANLFMAKLESNFLSSCPIRPQAYYRYIDDILIIWMESGPQLKTFHEQFNQFHPTINLTLSYSSTFWTPSSSCRKMK
ncbi:unnamed protein product [Ranitomeya imitator]|uniref:Reverse transcriptase domain-containing protein n=1 Tax=Ranitomeya imitator TaxID=111125 RepID=A0ABN9MIJ9_9NEOB|nr:unnamed protein product [Ranitomeya imitator]